MSVARRILFDARSAATSRITGWERYTRTLLSIACEWDDVVVSASDSTSRVSRVASDWGATRRLQKRYSHSHFPSFVPVRFPVGHTAISTIHDLTWWRYPETASRWSRGYYAPLARAALRKSQLIATVSSVVREEILELNPSADVRIVSPVAALANVEPVVPSRPKPYFVAVGSIEPRKNFSRLAEAFAASGLSRDFDLVLVGRRAWGRLPSGVVGVGAVGDPELRGLVEHSQGLISPSLYEGFGSPGVEARNLGVKVACSDIPVFRETTPTASVWFDPSSTESMAAAFRLLLDSPEPGASCEYHRPRTAAELRALYDFALGR